MRNPPRNIPRNIPLKHTLGNRPVSSKPVARFHGDLTSRSATLAPVFRSHVVRRRNAPDFETDEGSRNIPVTYLKHTWICPRWLTGHFLFEAVLSMWEINSRTPNPKIFRASVSSSRSSHCGMASTKAGTASTKAVSERKLKYTGRANSAHSSMMWGTLTVIKQSLWKEELPKFAALAAQPIEKGDKNESTSGRAPRRFVKSIPGTPWLEGGAQAPRARWRKPTQVVRPPPAQRSVAPTMGPAPEHVLLGTSTGP